jgi:hypothetical protein
VTAASRLAIALVVASGVAYAQTPSEADLAFKKGRELLKAGKFVEACAEFEHSERLDPQLGTRFNIAQCEEGQGKLADALELFRELADKDTNAQRKSVSAEHLAALEKRVPRVQVQIDNPPAGLAVKLGDKPAQCTGGKCEARVDRGHYTAVATAPGFKAAHATVDVETEGATMIVKLALEPAPDHGEPVGTTPPLDAQNQAPPPPASSHRKMYGLVTAGVGGAALATGAIFGVLANGNWSDAKAACGGGTTCTDPTSLAKANSLRDSANSKATVSTGLFIAGGVLAAVGVVLYVTAPSDHEITVAPAGTGVSLSGRF